MIPPGVVVVGDVMLDVVVRPDEPVAPTSDTPSSVRIGRGGSGANIAVELSLDGLDVTYLGAAGDDAAGRLFVEDLERAGVKATLQLVDASTGVVVAIIAESGQRSMMTDRGANRLLTPEHLQRHLDGSYDHLHVSGYCLLDDATRVGAVAALRSARERGRSTSIDVCSVGPLRRVTSDVFMNAARGATMLFANEEEATTLSGVGNVDDAIGELGLVFSEVMVTRGADGALTRLNGSTTHAPSLSRDVLDTTGAGDAATGAYLAARLKGHDVGVALRAAMEASAAVVKGLGSRG